MKSKAVYFLGNKGVELREINISDPVDDEVQARTLVNGICMWEVWLYNHAKIDQPKLAGHEGIGVVTKVGKNVKNFKENDLITTCEWSEYTNQKENNIIKLSRKPSDIDSCMLEPLACAINASANVKIYPGDKVILFGAGYMGLLLIQLLAMYPLSRLVVVDIKPKNLELALKYGADEVINSSTDEGKKRLQELIDTPFDIAYECSGANEPLNWCTKLVKRGGQVGIYAWHHDTRTVDASMWHDKGLSILNLSPGMTANERRFRSFEAAEKLMSAGKIVQYDFITNKYSLDEIKKAMEESTIRTDGFIKSVIKF